LFLISSSVVAILFFPEAALLQLAVSVKVKLSGAHVRPKHEEPATRIVFGLAKVVALFLLAAAAVAHLSLSRVRFLNSFL
jgi:hypothetical protein